MRFALLALRRLCLLVILSGKAWIGWQILQRMPPTLGEVQHATVQNRQKIMESRPFVTVGGAVEVTNEVDVKGRVDVDGTVTVSEIQAPVQIERAC